MINRTLLRTKTVQVLYAMYVKQNLDLHAAESEIAVSAKKSYDLYNYILMLLVEIHNMACLRNELTNNRLSDINKKEAIISDRFIGNRFIRQLADNYTLRKYAETEKLTWADHQDTVKSLLNSILSSEYYTKWLESETDNYGNDCELWRKIVRKELTDSEDLAASIEEDNVYWVCGLDLIIEFVIKTIKMFEESNGANQPLLPMFDKDKGEDLKYATDLIDTVIINNAKTDEDIIAHLKNWELNRIPLMDKVILKCAMGEMTANSNTPHNIVINEYVEIAKYFSSLKSAKFINSVLDKMASARQAQVFN